ncbi:MAG TPA: hypothetical protein VJP88_11790 [Caulobacteraceae bacterium]|nr:hypothetical protein [Caulobacteraceae bacterium]
MRSGALRPSIVVTDIEVAEAAAGANATASRLLTAALADSDLLEILSLPPATAQYALTGSVARVLLDGHASVGCLPGLTLRLVERRTGQTIAVIRSNEEDLASKIAETLVGRPWQARVVDVGPRGQIRVNAGADSGLRSGDRMGVHRIIETTRDPATGAVSNENAVQFGEIVLMQVGAKSAVGLCRRPTTVPAMSGDFVMPADPAPARRCGSGRESNPTGV